MPRTEDAAAESDSSNATLCNACSKALQKPLVSSSLAVVPQPVHRLRALPVTCCHLSDPECLQSLSCLARLPVPAPVIASSMATQTSLTTLSPLAVSFDDELHGHAMANMYGFHI